MAKPEEKAPKEETIEEKQAPEMETIEYAILTRPLRDAIIGELGRLPHNAVRGSIDALMNLRMQQQQIVKQAPPVAPQEADTTKHESTTEDSGDQGPQGSQG